MITPMHYFFIIIVGAIFVTLAYGDNKGFLRINNVGLEFAMWVVIIALFMTMILPKILFFM